MKTRKKYLEVNIQKFEKKYRANYV